MSTDLERVLEQLVTNLVTQVRTDMEAMETRLMDKVKASLSTVFGAGSLSVTPSVRSSSAIGNLRQRPYPLPLHSRYDDPNHAIGLCSPNNANTLMLEVYPVDKSENQGQNESSPQCQVQVERMTVNPVTVDPIRVFHHEKGSTAQIVGDKISNFNRPSAMINAKSTLVKITHKLMQCVVDTDQDQSPTSQQLIGLGNNRNRPTRSSGGHVNSEAVQSYSCKSGSKTSLQQLQPGNKIKPVTNAVPSQAYCNCKPKSYSHGQEGYRQHHRLTQRRWLCYVCGNSICNGGCNWRRMSPSSASKFYNQDQMTIDGNWRTWTNRNWRCSSSPTGSCWSHFNGTSSSLEPKPSWQYHSSMSDHHDHHSSWRQRYCNAAQGRPILGRR